MSDTDTDVRSRIAIALDVSTLDEATRLADAVSGSIGVAKIGLQLFSAAGPAAVDTMRRRGFDVLLDLKLHDIPNTVAGAAREIGRMGVRYVTSHTQGGEAMLRAAVEGLAEGADEAGLATPRVLAVPSCPASAWPAAVTTINRGWRRRQPPLSQAPISWCSAVP